LPAAEYDHFTPAAQAAFWSAAWKITAESNRYGYRLAGAPLSFNAPLEMLSHGIVPGVIQVPPAGQPIIQMRDAQPSGGYPKLGTVIEADLWRLGQAPIGSLIRFIQTDWTEALAATDAVQAWLFEVARLIELRRTVWQ
jgi:allophanate hydrolase subunit 2